MDKRSQLVERNKTKKEESTTQNNHQGRIHLTFQTWGTELWNCRKR